jgi:hypothetical protein
MIKTLVFALLLPIFCNAQSIDNLDIKNGFRQFKLGDSISKYKDEVEKPHKATPNSYPVKLKSFNKLRRYLGAITLVVESGAITEIDIYVEGDYNETYIDDAMKKCYGDGIVVNSDNDISEGVHTTNLIWEGKRVTALVKKWQYNMDVGATRVEIKKESVIFKKTGDLSIDGQLPPDFQL